jgi:hypothetical protein
MHKEKEVLFKVTADDCRWDYYRGSGDAAKAYAEREIKSDRIRVEVKKDGKWTLEEI